MVPPSDSATYAAESRADVSALVPARPLRRPVVWDSFPTVRAGAVPLRRWVLDRGCRVVNIVAAILLLVLFGPLMVLIAVAVRLSSPGPVIFRQDRVGLDRRSKGDTVSVDRRRLNQGGRLFRIYKFRTMYQAEVSGGGAQVWASSDDARVTPVGRVLRPFRLDELPQLFNVLKGDMNIVGPRPEQPRIFDELRDELDRYHVRQRVLPGITGLAQVSQGYDETVEDVKRKLGYDLEYIRRRSPLEDLRIMARTAPVMILRKGAR